MEKHIKERLVGAVVLVAIVVIAVPELLTGPREHPPATAPPPVAAPVRTVTIDLATGAQRDSIAADRIGEAPPPGAPAASPPPETSVMPEQPVASRGAVERARAPAAAANPETAPAASIEGDASVSADTPSPRVGATQPPRAASAASPPAEDRTPASAAPSPRPAPARPTAVAGTAPPRPAAPSTSAAEGWVVQLGSFASRANADRLVAELRAQGYAGFVSEFRGSGRVLYRVRVGPEQDRARAEAIAQRLAREGKKGSISPHP